MTTKSENSGIIVAFHIGRGGLFHNQGHRTFLGFHKIGDYTDNLFLNEETGEYADSSTNSVGLTASEVATGIGRIDIDGDYDTTYCQYIEDCSDAEIDMILDSPYAHEAMDWLMANKSLEMMDRAVDAINEKMGRSFFGFNYASEVAHADGSAEKGNDYGLWIEDGRFKLASTGNTEFFNSDENLVDHIVDFVREIEDAE